MPTLSLRRTGAIAAALAALVLSPLDQANAQGSSDSARAAPRSRGQQVYVSVYSHLTSGDRDPRRAPKVQTLLAALVSIRNVEPNASFRVTSARYFDTDGKMLREFVTSPITVRPMGTVEFFIDQTDTSGGSGANFLISWESDGPITAPLVETVHSDLRGTRSIVFVTTGRALDR